MSYPEGLRTETGSTVSWELGSVSTLNNPMLVVPHLPHDQLCPTGGNILSVQRFKGRDLSKICSQGRVRRCVCLLKR